MDYCSVGDEVVRTRHISEKDLNELKIIYDSLSKVNNSANIYSLNKLQEIINNVNTDYLDKPDTEIIRRELSKIEVQTLICKKIKAIALLLKDNTTDKEDVRRFKLLYELIRLCQEIK